MTNPPKLETVDVTDSLEHINDIIARDGGVIVKNFLSLELLQEVKAAIEPHFEGRSTYDSASTHGELGKKFFPEGSVRIYGLLPRIPDQMVQILRNPVWHGIMDRFLSDTYSSYTGETLLPQKSGYMLSTTASFRIVPGVKPQPLHRDQVTYQTREDPRNPLYTPKVGCLIAVTNCTKKNGATAVLPGSHLWSHDRIPHISECTYAEMEAGSALFTLGSTYHSASANTSDPSDPDALRTLLAVFGQRDYYRQDQMEFLLTPLEIVKRLPEDILRLIGFYKATGGTAYVENHQNLIEFLDREDTLLGRFKTASTDAKAKKPVAA